MKGLDTNVLVRFVVEDDKKQAAVAAKFIEKNCSDDNPCYISHISLCEFTWVLDGSYKQSRTTIAEVIEEFLLVGALEVQDPDVVWRALRDYQESNADFPDHLIARVNQQAGCEYTVTFDKKASKEPAFELIK